MREGKAHTLCLERFNPSFTPLALWSIKQHKASSHVPNNTYPIMLVNAKARRRVSPERRRILTVSVQYDLAEIRIITMTRD
jgi:hypothetical protein